MPVSGHMKVVLLDPYRAEDTELCHFLSLNMFPSASGECIIGKCFVWRLMTHFTLPCAGVSAGLKYIRNIIICLYIILNISL